MGAVLVAPVTCFSSWLTHLSDSIHQSFESQCPGDDEIPERPLVTVFHDQDTEIKVSLQICLIDLPVQEDFVEADHIHMGQGKKGSRFVQRSLDLVQIVGDVDDGDELRNAVPFLILHSTPVHLTETA